MTRTNQILAGVLAAVVASAGFYFLALAPKREEASKLKTDIAAAQKTLDEARATLANYTKAKANYRQAYESVVRLGKAVPADDDVRSLMIQLDAAAKQSRVDFAAINVGGSPGTAAPVSAAGATTPGAAASASLPPGVTVGPAGFPAMPFSFNFTGKFFRLGEFFTRLERFVTVNNKKVDVTGRLMTVDSFSLEPDASGFPTIKATVGATSFLVSPQQGLTAGATPEGPAGAQPGATTAPSTGDSPAPSTTATSTGAFR